MTRTFAMTGRLEWIGLRKAHRSEVVSVGSARLVAGYGIEGDHAGQCLGRKRQVSLIQHEHLPLIARFAGVKAVEPALLRRNLMISGTNLLALKHRCFRIGEAVFEAVGDCHPCRRMEEAIGRGGFRAMCGYGGLVAVVKAGGGIAVGDAVLFETSRSQ